MISRFQIGELLELNNKPTMINGDPTLVSEFSGIRQQIDYRKL